MGKYTIAYLDILGFKEILKEYKLENIGIAYTEIIDKINKLINDDAIFFNDIDSCLKSFFSDSIIVCSGDDTEQGCLNVIRYVVRAMQLMHIIGAPIRGGIAFGEMYIEESKNIFIGHPLVMAAELEKEQEWIGVAIDKTVEEQFPDLFKNPIQEIKLYRRA